MMQVDHLEGLSVLSLEASRLDAKASRPFKEQVEELAKEGHTRLLLDMANLEFVDSSGVGALVAALKAVTAEGDLQLCGVRPSVLSLLRLTRLDRIFKIHENVDLGKANFG
jgi:anti-sigma B factor antagonist